MKNFFRFVFVIIIVLGFHHNALAQGAIKIGVVDIEKLRQKSVAFEKGRAEYKKKVAVLEKKLREEGEALKKLQEEYQKQSMMLSLDAQEDKRKELLSKNRLYKFHVEDYTAQIKEVEAEVTNRLRRDLDEVVREIGEKGGYTFITEKRNSGLLFNDVAIDITDEVISAYDKAYQ